MELTVERLSDGEVSPCLTEELAVDDRLELRGQSAVDSCGARGRLNQSN